MTSNKNIPRLEVYLDRSVLIERDGEPEEFLEGLPTENAKSRLAVVKAALAGGFLTNLIENCQNPTADVAKLDEPHQSTIESLVSSVTSEVGRAIIGLTILQLCVKTISPEQSIRLHKSGAGGANFSWQEGLPMRVLDKSFITPVLRQTGLLNLNADGFMMTRSLAENYPYSSVYKAAIRGARQEWLQIVKAIEVDGLAAESALKSLIFCLVNRSDRFHKDSAQCMNAIHQVSKILTSLDEAASFIVQYVTAAPYSARLFEVAMHSLFQVLDEAGALEGELKPLSQMRSANKKHGNIGDIEVLQRRGGMLILESWDAKFGKLDLRDELEELNEKLMDHSETKLVGFVTDGEPILRDDLVARMSELQDMHDVKIDIISFRGWLHAQAARSDMPPAKTAEAWVNTFAECLCQLRREQAPIDEPCDAWVVGLRRYAEAFSKVELPLS